MCKGVSLHMAVGFDYPELADFFFLFFYFFLLQLFLASQIAASISLRGCVKLTFFLGPWT